MRLPAQLLMVPQKRAGCLVVLGETFDVQRIITIPDRVASQTGVLQGALYPLVLGTLCQPRHVYSQLVIIGR